MSGVTVGDGAVIAARALVTKDVPPYGIVAGQPAKLLRYRFAPDIIERLLTLAWWNWQDERIKKAVPKMLQTDIEAFLQAAENGEI